MDPVTLGIVLAGGAVVVGLLTLVVNAASAHWTRRQYHLALEGSTGQSDQAMEGVDVDSQDATAPVREKGAPRSALEDSGYRAWLKEETGFIDIRGIGTVGGKGIAATRFPILDLYTQLHVQRGLTNFDLDQGTIRGNQRVALIEVLDATRCLAIMGDPGSGKTTFLKYAASMQLLNPSGLLPFYFSLPDVYEFLTQKEAPEPLVHHDVIRSFRPEALIDFAMDINHRHKLDLDRSGLENAVLDGKCMWLVDGLDELASSEIRDAMVEAVTQATRRWGRCKFVLASRPLALTGKAIPPGFEVVGIDDLRDEEIMSFLDKWTSLLFAGSQPSKQKEYSEELYTTIIQTPQLRALARNPVMLTSMAVLHFNDKHLPEGRADLLEAVIHWLIHSKRRLRRGGETAEFIEDVYRKLALSMFEHEGGRKIRVGRGWAATRIAEHFGGNAETALQFLGREENETGLLVRRGEGDLGFWHTWFQEYLAAKEIAGKTDDPAKGWWSKAEGHLDESGWREVLCLIPACLIRLGSDRVDLYFERLASSSAGTDLATKVKRVGLGGHVLRDVLAGRYDPQNVRPWKVALEDIVPIFGPAADGLALRDRYDAAIAYGLGGDARLGRFEATWASFAGGAFFMGAQAGDSSQPNYDPLAASWESPVVEVHLAPFELRKYPITVGEFGEFVSKRGYHCRDYWTDEGWKWRLENHVEEPGDWDEQALLWNCPVTAISWFEAIAFCRWLTAKDLARGLEYRLPSEAEWEYAARNNISTDRLFPWGNELTEGERAEANWGGCNLRKKSPVGMFPKSNTVDGLADMVGNVEEWCADAWSASHIDYPPDRKPRTNETEPRRIVRGGSTIRFLRLCRLTYRSRCHREKRYHTIGFRPARSLHPSTSLNSELGKTKGLDL